MDTSQVAKQIGTTPRQLRAFLRSEYSTFQAVGSGARYDFTDSEIPTIEKRFSAWRADGKPRPEPKPQPVTKSPRSTTTNARDAQVWSEEGEVILEDIRDPRVRARVKANAAAAENHLMTLLIAKGMHISQGWTPPTTRKVS